MVIVLIVRYVLLRTAVYGTTARPSSSPVAEQSVFDNSHNNCSRLGVRPGARRGESLGKVVVPFSYYSGWGGDEAGSARAPSLGGPLLADMFTRKQQWRRTRTRKHAWGNLPPEVVEAMLAAGGGTGVPKSVSWDHSYSAGLMSRDSEAADAARRAAKQENSSRTNEAAVAARAAKTTSAAVGVSAAAAAEAEAAAAAEAAASALHLPRSVSCSSLAPKRTLFPRTSSRDDLGPSAAARRANAARGRLLPRRRGVSFDTQVRESDLTFGWLLLCKSASPCML